jgi:hypothetical protein
MNRSCQRAGLASMYETATCTACPRLTLRGTRAVTTSNCFADSRQGALLGRNETARREMGWPKRAWRMILFPK